MFDELNFREARIGLKGAAILAAASAGIYAFVKYGGQGAVYVIAGITLGFLVHEFMK